MSYVKSETIDYNPGGTTVKGGVQACDDNIDDLLLH